MNNSEIQNVELWVRDYSDSLYSWALHKTSSQVIAEDLVQDTFLSAFQHMDKFKGNSSPKTWLFSILNNKIIDHYRKSSKKEILASTEESKMQFEATESFFSEDGSWNQSHVSTGWGNDGSLLDDEDFNRIMEICMDDLPGNWRQAVSFKYLFEKDAKEICQELNITLSNYWQVIHRAKLLLKKCLEINYFKHV